MFCWGIGVVEYFSYYETEIIVSFVKQGLTSKEISDLLRSDERQIVQFLIDNNLYKEEDKKDSKKNNTPLMSRLKSSLNNKLSDERGKFYRRK